MTQYDATMQQGRIPRLSRVQFRAASLYLMAGLGLGIAMAASGDFMLKGVHGHMHLLGWVSLALTGVVYAVAPHLAQGRLARWHVGLHNLGLPIMLAALTAYHMGVAAAEPVIAIGAMLSTLGLGAFTLAIWRAL